MAKIKVGDGISLIFIYVNVQFCWFIPSDLKPAIFELNIDIKVLEKFYNVQLTKNSNIYVWVRYVLHKLFMLE